MQPNNKTGFTAPYNYNQPIPLAPPMYTPAAAPPTYPNFQIQMTPAPQYYQAPYPPQNFSFPPHAHIIHQPPGPPPAYGGPQYPTGYCPAPPYQQPQPQQQQHLTHHQHPHHHHHHHHHQQQQQQHQQQQHLHHQQAPAALYNVATMQRAVFDDGARFNGKGAGSLAVPPPPPGYVPTPAQIAAMQGQQVMMKQKKANFFTGGKGGFTFW